AGAELRFGFGIWGEGPSLGRGAPSGEVEPAPNQPGDRGWRHGAREDVRGPDLARERGDTRLAAGIEQQEEAVWAVPDGAAEVVERRGDAFARVDDHDGARRPLQGALELGCRPGLDDPLRLTREPRAK